MTAASTYGNPDRNEYILETTGTGAAIFDYDGDGDNDIFIANGTTFALERAVQSPPSFLYRNEGDLRFQEVAKTAGLTRAGWAQSPCAADYDNDGATDLFVTYFGSNALYRNLRKGRFLDATADALPEESESRWGAGCAFLDYDRDGYLDLFVSNYVELDLASTPKPGDSAECRWKGIPVMCGPRGLPLAHNALYRNRGDGTFEDVSEAAGILAPGGRYSLGVVVADFNNDRWPDIYVACDMTPSLLYRNNGDGSFEEIGSAAGVAFSFDGQLQAGMGVATADYDGNGFLDILKSNFSGDLPSLYNDEDGEFFEDLSLPAGLGVNQYLGWGALFLDVDADTWPDILLAHGHVYPEVEDGGIGETYRQPTVLYRNLANGGFEDISAKAGPALLTHRPARGMAAGDVDGDGRPEVLIVNVNQPPSLLKDSAPSGNFLWLRLEGTESNRSAVGARATVQVGDRQLLQEVAAGGSYYSQSDLALFFGLGATEQATRVRIDWPSGARQEHENLAANQRYLIREGSAHQRLP